MPQTFTLTVLAESFGGFATGQEEAGSNLGLLGRLVECNENGRRTLYCLPGSPGTGGGDLKSSVGMSESSGATRPGALSGILASLLEPLAQARISVLSVSTFDTTASILSFAGHQILHA